jgi:hypothetical protein
LKRSVPSQPHERLQQLAVVKKHYRSEAQDRDCVFPVFTTGVGACQHWYTGWLRAQQGARKSRRTLTCKRSNLLPFSVVIYCLLVWLLRNLEILRSWAACYTHSVCCRPFFYKLFFCTLPIAGLQCSSTALFDRKVSVYTAVLC